MFARPFPVSAAGFPTWYSPVLSLKSQFAFSNNRYFSCFAVLADQVLACKTATRQSDY